MLTTKELIQWCHKAQKKREESWLAKTARYTTTVTGSVMATKPPKATKTETDIAITLTHSCWSEIQVWQEEFTKL